MGSTPRKTVYRLGREQLRLIKQSFEGQSFPILTNGSRVWSINQLYHHAVFTDCERQDKIFVIAGKIVRWDHSLWDFIHRSAIKADPSSQRMPLENCRAVPSQQLQHVLWGGRNSFPWLLLPGDARVIWL